MSDAEIEAAVAEVLDALDAALAPSRATRAEYISGLRQLIDDARIRLEAAREEEAGEVEE
jgi:hypothetical protein